MSDYTMKPSWQDLLTSRMGKATGQFYVPDITEDYKVGLLWPDPEPPAFTTKDHHLDDFINEHLSAERMRLGAMQIRGPQPTTTTPEPEIIRGGKKGPEHKCMALFTEPYRYELGTIMECPVCKAQYKAKMTDYQVEWVLCWRRRRRKIGTSKGGPK